MTDLSLRSAPGGVSSVAAQSRLLVPLSLFALYVIWGSTYLAIRIALVSYPPFLLAGVRFLVAGGLLFGVLRLRGVAAPSARQWRNAAITGVLLLGFGNGLVCFAEQRVSSGIAAVAVASMPLFAALFSSIYREWPTPGECLGLAMGFIGVIVLNLGHGLSASRIGAIALLTAAMCWALGSVWSKRQDMPAGPMNTAAQMLCGSAALLGVGFAGGERLPTHPSLPASLALAYLIVLGSLVAFSAYLYLLKHARPALATSYAYVNPVIAILLGMLLMGEQVGGPPYLVIVPLDLSIPLELIGMALILLSVGAITLVRQRRR